MKTIILKPNGLGRYDDVSPFIMAENKIELKINLPKQNGEFFLVGENNGKSYKKPLSTTENVVLEGLSAGELNLEVKHYIKGALLNTYSIEPLLLCELNTDLTGTPVIAALRAEIAKLKEVIAEEQKRAVEREKAFEMFIKELSAREEKINAKIAALIRFALNDYRYNVYLGGGDLAKFMAEFGLELTDEEKKLIGGKNND